MPLSFTRPLLLAAAVIALAMALVACGDSEESTSVEVSTSSSTELSSTSSTVTESTTAATTTPTTSSSCADVEIFDVEPAGTHFDRDFTADDYPTNPPTAGDHNPMPIQTGQFYAQPPRLGESVHALEHGAVIGWTNGLSPEDQKAVEEAFNQEYAKGYHQLAVVENPDLEVPFAISTWDSLQRCDAVDTEAISSFIEEHYAPSSTAEGSLACSGKASRLPACRTRTDP